MNIGTIVQDGMTLTAFLGDLPAQWSGNFDVTVSIDENFGTYTPYLSVGYMTDNIGRAVLLEIVNGVTTIPSVCFEHSGLIMMSVTLIKGDEILNTKPVTIKVEHAPMVLSEIDPEDEGIQDMLEALIDAKIEAVIPTGGTTGQVLMKNSDADYDLKWGNGGGGGGAVDSVNGKTGAVVLDADDVGALPDTTTASDLGAYVKPSGGIPKSDLASAVQTSLGKADTALQSAPVTSVNGRTGVVTGLEEETTVQTMTSSDTSVTLQTNKFYVFPEMSALSVTVTATGMYQFRFESGATATTLTVTGATMPDSFTVEANKVYEINIYQGYGVATSWTAS